jgi:sigma-E factor negative regulatory protein RseB
MRSKNKNNLTTSITTVLITLSLLLVPATVVFADNPSIEAQKLIDEMSRASRDLNYDGVFVYKQAGQMNTMRIIHRADKKGEHERLVSLTGFAREVIRDGNTVRCFYPEKQSVMVEKSQAGTLVSSYLPHPIESISEYYQFTIVAEDRVAGRDAWVVNIIPRDNYRYGYQLWIDQTTKLLLKSELKDSNGVTLEQIMFTQLDVLEQIPDSLLEPTTTGTDYTWYQTADNGKAKMPSGGKHWKLTWMPDGFAMSEYGKQSISMSKMPVEHMVFTDGLAMVSVFVEKLTKDLQVVEGPSTMGGINTFAILSGGYQVTAVGEVPRATVKLMAGSAKQIE